MVCKQDFSQSENILTRNSLSFSKFAKIKISGSARKGTDCRVFSQPYPLPSSMLQMIENVIKTCQNEEMIVL